MAFDFGSACFAWTTTNYLHLKRIYWFWLFIISYHRRSVKLDPASACVHFKEVLPNEIYWPLWEGRKSCISSTSSRTGIVSVWVFQETDARMELRVQNIHWEKYQWRVKGRECRKVQRALRPSWASDSGSKRRRVWRQKDWVGGNSASLSLWDHPEHVDREPQGPVCAFEASPLSRKSQLALIPLGPGLSCEPRRTWCVCEHCVNPTVATALCRDLSWMGI